MHLLPEADCGPKAWTVLKELHAPTSVASLMLERELSALRLSEGEPVQPVLDKMRDLYAKLATAGITYPEQTKCLKMLSLLPESWLQFTSGLSLPQNQSLWTLMWVRTKILEEDFRRRQLRGGDDGSSGYGIQGSQRGRGRGIGGAGRGAKKDNDSNDQQGGTGWGRGVKSGRGGKSGAGGKMKGSCWYCEKEGHPWFLCYKKPDGWTPQNRHQDGGARRNQKNGANMVADSSDKNTKSSGGVAWTMTPRKEMIDDVQAAPINEVCSTSGHALKVAGVGRAAFKRADSKPLVLHDVFLVPDLKANLISLRKLAKAGVSTSTDGACTYKGQLGNRVLWDLHESKDVYRSMWQLPALPWHGWGAGWRGVCIPGGVQRRWKGWCESVGQIWEDRLGNGTPTLRACGNALVEAAREGWRHQGSKKPLELVHMDLVGLLLVQAHKRERYFLTIVDDWSRLMWAYPLKHMDHAASTIQEDRLPFVEKQAGCVVKRIRTDRGGEFLGTEMTAWLKKQGIQRKLTTAYTPQSNGVAERANRTILETARTLLIESGVSNSMWPHAVRHATLARNRVLTKVGNESWPETKVSQQMEQITMKLDLTPRVREEGEEAAAEGGDGEKVQEEPAGGGGGVETNGRTSGAAGPEGEQQTSSCDESLLLKGEGEKLVLFLVHLDDIILFSRSMKEIQKVQQQLMKNFKCKTVGEVKYYLGMHVERDLDHRWLKHQEKFIKELGEKYGIENERKVATPLPAEFKLVKAAEDEGVEAEEQQQFQSLVGSHLYAVVHTKPDISFSVGQLASMVQNPSEEQVNGAERVVRAELHPIDYLVLDTGAAWTMMPRMEMIDDVRAAPINEVCSTSGQALKVAGVGRAAFKRADSKPVVPHDVLLIPDLKANLISLRKPSKAGVSTSTDGARTYKGQLGNWAGEGSASQGECNAVGRVGVKVSARSGETDWATAHRRLGHVAMPLLKKLEKDGGVK
ncbi:unnamed protein product, partial [Closterium sp. NIES-54]